MDFESIGVLGIALVLVLVVLCVFACVWIVATFIASYLGLTGIVWWAFSIVLFLIINGLLGGISVRSVD